MTDKQKASNESPLCWVRPVTTAPDLGGFQVCLEGEGFPVWAHPNGMYAPVSAEPVALPQCPFPCGWSGLYKIAVQDAAYLAKVQWPEDEEGVNVPRATAMRSMDQLIQVCRTMLNAAPVAAQAQHDLIRFDYVNADGQPDSKMITHDEMRERYAVAIRHAYGQAQQPVSGADGLQGDDLTAAYLLGIYDGKKAAQSQPSGQNKE